MGDRKNTVLGSFGEVHQTGQGTGVACVGIRVPVQTHNPDRLLRGVAWGVAAREGFRRISPVGPIETTTDIDGTDVVWHRATFKVGR